MPQDQKKARIRALEQPRRRRRHQVNGLPMLADLDGRSLAGKAARDLAAALERDLGGDLSAADTVLVTQAAVLAVYCEARATAWLAGGGEGDLPRDHGPMVGQLRRLLETLGTERVPKHITMTSAERHKAKHDTSDIEAADRWWRAEQAKRAAANGGSTTS
jgi:hypothetical protein